MSWAICTALLLAPALWGAGQAAPVEIQAAVGADDVLQRDPRDLPRAETKRWEAWKPEDAVPAEMREGMRQGMETYFAGDYAAAARHYWVLLEREPDFPPALYYLGATYFRLRRYGNCALVFERFQSAVPSAVGATQALAHSYYSLGDYPAALAQYEAVLAANPKSVEALRGCALTQMRLGQLERALELFDACLELSPEHFEALYWRAQTLFDLGRTADARAGVERARDLEPFDPRPWFLLGQVLFDQGEDEAADAAKARFLELNLHAQKVRTLEGLLLHDPRRVEVYTRLFDVQRAAGNKAGAREVIAALLRAIPDELDVRAQALRLLAELGERELALELAADMERDFLEVPEAWRHLRDFYAGLGDRVRQVRAGERYLRLGGDPTR
jgi:tetratricopeptide (TPR) repeat protein